MIGSGSHTPPEPPTTKNYAHPGARYQAPVGDFVDHDADQSLGHDNMGHLAPSGLVY